MKARALRREPVKQAYSLRANHPLYGWPRFPTVLGDKASSIKASAPFQISFQTRFRLSQTTETGDETGVFLMVLGMKSEDFDSFEPGESEQS